MANAKELTKQIKELHEKQTDEMRSLEEQAWALTLTIVQNGTKRTLF